jgi:DNA-binding MarR family transcriptional regulator
MVTLPRSGPAEPAIRAIEPELAFLARLLEAAQKRRIYALERAHYLILDRIERDGPQPVGVLAEALLLDNSTVTRQLAAMVELGLVRKSEHPQDRRRAVIEVTAKGRTLGAQMREQRRQRIGYLLRNWTGEERKVCADVIARLNRAFYERLRETE